jgi:hypothetical protein
MTTVPSLDDEYDGLFEAIGIETAVGALLRPFEPLLKFLEIDVFLA